MTISLFDQNTIILLFVAFAGMIIWRYLGVLYSKNIDNESIIAKTINSIAYGMTTAIVFKIVFFPDNALNLIPDTDRIIPFFIGIIGSKQKTPSAIFWGPRVPEPHCQATNR